MISKGGGDQKNKTTNLNGRGKFESPLPPQNFLLR